MVSVVISVGSNCGDRMGLLKNALNWLEKILIQIETSDIYETPCARQEGKPYLNVVVKGFFEGTGFQLEDLLKDKERNLGRTADSKTKGEVPIDMDIVICNNEILKPWDFRQKFFRLGYQQLSPNSTD